MTLLAAAALGLVVGLVLGALGGGGGVLTVPVLVYALGETVQNATTGSLIIVGIAAGFGALARRRTGLVAWRTSFVFGAIGIPAAYLGTALNQRLDPAVLLLAFACLVLAVALTMLAGTRRSEPPTDTETQPDVAAAPGGTLTTVHAAQAAAVAKLVVAAVAVGLLTGLLGVGGGFLIVPALVIALRMPMPTAIATSLLVITVNSAASLLARVAGAHVDWSIVGPFTLTAVLATLIGKWVADRLSGQALTRAFAILLIAVAAFVAVQSVRGMT